MNKFEIHKEEWNKLVSLINDDHKVRLYYRINIMFKTSNLIVLYRKDFDDYYVFPINGVFNRLGTGDKTRKSNYMNKWYTIRIGASLDKGMILYVEGTKQTFSLSSGIEIDEKLVDNVKDVKQHIAKELI